MHQTKNTKRPKLQGNGLLHFFALFGGFFAIYFVLFLLGSFVVFALNPAQAVQFEIILAFLFLASLVCGFLAAKRKNEHGWLSGLLFCLPMHLILTIVSFCMNGLSADWTLLFSFLILTVGSMLGGIIAVNQRKKPHLKRIKKRKA